MRPIGTLHVCVLMVAALAATAAPASVSNQEAATLKSRLTPVGAERDGNADGSIPAWTGGVTAAPGYVAGAPRPDPFAADKPLFTITARNFRDYDDKLPEGAKALFAKYPDYRDGHLSRPIAARPRRTGSMTISFATPRGAHAAPEGIAYGVEGAVGGIPFPIPKNGFEAMWNHLLAFWGAGARAERQYLCRVGGRGDREDQHLPGDRGFSLLLSGRDAGFFRRLLLQDPASGGGAGRACRAKAI